MDAYESKVLEKYKPSNFPKCDCNELASLRSSYSSKNSNRPYFRRQDTDPEEKCSFSLWTDNVSKPRKRKRKASSEKERKSSKRSTGKRDHGLRRKIESSSDEDGQK